MMMLDKIEHHLLCWHQKHQLGGEKWDENWKALQSYIPILRPDVHGTPQTPHTLERQAPLTLLSSLSRMRTLQMENILECIAEILGRGVGGVLGATRYNTVAKRPKLSRQMETFGKGHLWIKKQKPKLTNAIVYDRLRSVGRNLERQIPSFPWHRFVLIWDYTSGFLQYFPLTEGKIWKTARCKTTVSTQPNPEACDLLVAYFRELKEETEQILRGGSFVWLWRFA